MKLSFQLNILSIFDPRYFAAFIGLFLFQLIAQAQDIHFSQFYNSPFNLNPGLVGQFDGAYRFIGNQRTQWRSITTPYSTLGLSADARHLRLTDGLLNSKDGKPLQTDWNVGLSFFTDKAGDSKLKTNMIHLILGKEIQVGNGDFSPAIMLGYTGMHIDYSALSYDNQWTGLVYDPSINPGEQYARSSRGYFNLNLGGAYRLKLSRHEKLVAGCSLFNLTNPKQSFFDDGYVKLDPRFNLHGQYQFPIANQWDLEPMMLFASQGSYKEFNFGGLAHFTPEERPWAQRSLYFGVLGRAKDAGYVVGGIKYDEWEAGISYDINTSNLKPASSGKGGFEFSVIYIIPPPPVPVPVRICPDWI